MKKILLALLGIFVVLGFFGVVGYAGYRFGYAQGIQATGNGDSTRPGIRPFDDFNPRRMPDFGMDRSFPRDFGRSRFPMIGFGFFSPLMRLGPLLVLTLIVLTIYWLFTRSGWRLTRPTTESAPPKPENE